MTLPPPVDGSAERTRWSAAAGHWDRWADPMAELADKLNRPLLDAAGAAPGHRILDLASGAGEPALSAARRAGPDGLVVGTDLVPAMLAGAVRRAADATPAPAFLAADMLHLPFPDGLFDAVTCRFGLMFVPDAVGALAEARRVLKPGGRLAMMVWGPRADNALFDLVGTVVEERLGPDPVHRLDALFRFAAPGSLTAALERAGFADAGETALTPVRRAPRGQPVWQATLAMTFGPRIAPLTEVERAALDAALADRFTARAEGDTVPLPAHVRIGTGRRE
ncbi:class I SAM-dependent methyltransferase [Azospirillum halopraeferens]|uniref:class I SAM-dependent methyltransferase n=1 Tax=Azospirillum halopraeferens TaxID=34010 RepID=UPI0004115905|nr:methyltransferase domain-containing protein [Azospirillum halopraeferens]